MLAVAHSGMNDLQKARAFLTQTIDLAPNHTAALQLLEQLPKQDTR
jgi:hypothetical protein